MQIMLGRGMAVERLLDCGSDAEVEIDDRSDPEVSPDSSNDRPQEAGDTWLRASPRITVNICDLKLLTNS
jgi:hypothetical protein